MNRDELAKDFMHVSATMLQNTSSAFWAAILGVEEKTYKPSRDFHKVVVKLAFRLADEFIEQSIV